MRTITHEKLGTGILIVCGAMAGLLGDSQVFH